jgi:hypothetical protein
MTDDIHDRPKQELTNTDPKPVKERRVSPRVRHAIDLLLTGQCRLKKDAAREAKLSPFNHARGARLMPVSSEILNPERPAPGG